MSQFSSEEFILPDFLTQENYLTKNDNSNEIYVIDKKDKFHNDQNQMKFEKLDCSDIEGDLLFDNENFEHQSNSDNINESISFQEDSSFFNEPEIEGRKFTNDLVASIYKDFDELEIEMDKYPNETKVLEKLNEQTDILPFRKRIKKKYPAASKKNKLAEKEYSKKTVDEESDPLKSVDCIRTKSCKIDIVLSQPACENLLSLAEYFLRGDSKANQLLLEKNTKLLEEKRITLDFEAILNRMNAIYYGNTFDDEQITNKTLIDEEKHWLEYVKEFQPEIDDDESKLIDKDIEKSFFEFEFWPEESIVNEKEIQKENEKQNYSIKTISEDFKISAVTAISTPKNCRLDYFHDEIEKIKKDALQIFECSDDLSQNNYKVNEDIQKGNEKSLQTFNTVKVTKSKPSLGLSFRTPSKKLVPVCQESLKIAEQFISWSQIDSSLPKNNVKITKTESPVVVQKKINGKFLKSAEEFMSPSQGNGSYGKTNKKEIQVKETPYFKTASQKLVPISSESIKLAEQFISSSQDEDILKDNGNKVELTKSTSSLNLASCSDNSSKVVEKFASLSQTNKKFQINSNQKVDIIKTKPALGLFRTASKKIISVSNKSLKMAEQFISSSQADENFQNNNEEQEVKILNGNYAIDSKNLVPINNKNLKTTEQFTSSIQTDESFVNNSNKNDEINKNIPFVGCFTTASKKTIAISEKSLKFAEQFIKSSQMEENLQDFSSKEIKTTPSIEKFKTASKKLASNIDKPLKITKSFVSSPQIDSSFHNSSKTEVSNFEILPQNSVLSQNTPLGTSSRKKIRLNIASLRKPKLNSNLQSKDKTETFKDKLNKLHDSNCFQSSQEDLICTDIINQTNFAEYPVSFVTASQKPIQVDKSALKKAALLIESTKTESHDLNNQFQYNTDHDKTLVGINIQNERVSDFETVSGKDTQVAEYTSKVDSQINASSNLISNRENIKKLNVLKLKIKDNQQDQNLKEITDQSFMTSSLKRNSTKTESIDLADKLIHSEDSDELNENFHGFPLCDSKEIQNKFSPMILQKEKTIKLSNVSNNRDTSTLLKEVHSGSNKSSKNQNNLDIKESYKLRRRKRPRLRD